MASATSATTTDTGQRSHLSAILQLGAPLVINNLAYAGITFADTVMAGHIGADALAAVAVGSNALQLQSLIGAGMMMALAPLVAHDYGAGRDAAAGRYLRQALWIALAMSVLPLIVAAVRRSRLHGGRHGACDHPHGDRLHARDLLRRPGDVRPAGAHVHERGSRPHAHDHADDGRGAARRTCS